MARLSLRWLTAALAAGVLAMGCDSAPVTPTPDVVGAEDTTPPADSVVPPSDRPPGANPDPGPDSGPGPDVMPPPPPTGEPCTADSMCGDDPDVFFCLVEARGLPGGYCSSVCATEADCGSSAGCAVTDDGNLCLTTCTEDSDCRAGYVCQPDILGVRVRGSNVCAPGTPGLAGSAFGDPCTTADSCPRGPSFCLDAADTDFPAGYCSTFCDPTVADSCPAGSTCVDNEAGGGFCAATCATDTDCRQADGYTCSVNIVGLSTGTRSVCSPGSATPVAAGALCEDHGDCTAGNGFCLGGFPGGYCTTVCDPAADPSGCGAGEICAGTAEGSGLCAQVCSADTDCRGGTGYICEPAFAGREVAGDTTVCTPGTQGTAGALIGIPCTADSMCTRGGICLTEEEQDFPAGYCSRFCDPTRGTAEIACNLDGATGNVCFPISNQDPTQGLCVDGCTVDGDCRTGYTCQPTAADAPSACLPPPP